MQIETLPEWSLSPADEAEIAALLARSFETDFGGRSFFTQRHHLRIVARTDRIIGHMALTLRAVRLGEDLVNIAGLADVATDGAYRGQGVAATLLQKAIAEARNSPAQFLLLFGTARLYAAAGARPIANPLLSVDLAGARSQGLSAESDGTLMMLPLHGAAWHDQRPLDLLGPKF